MTKIPAGRLAALLPAAALAAAPLALAAPADAASLTNRDYTHDVRRWDPPAETMTKAPAQANGDLKRYTVQYGAHRIRVVEVFRELDRSNPVLVVGGTLKLPDRSTHDLVVKARQGDWQGTARLEGRPRCAVEHHLHYATNQAVIVVPASCLGTPASVRFQAAAVTTDKWSDPSYAFIDVAPGSVNADRYSAAVSRG